MKMSIYENYTLNKFAIPIKNYVHTSYGKIKEMR